MKNKMHISIPEGHFEGDCYTCFFYKTKSIQNDGRLFCKNCNSYVSIKDKYNCSSYLWKIKGWLIRGIWIYFIITGIVILIENFF